MKISPLALAAKKVIDAAWYRGASYDLSSQAAFALESAQLLQSPETVAESDHRYRRLRTAMLAVQRDRRKLRARVAELEARLDASNEAPIAYALTDKAVPPVEAVARPQRQTLRDLVARQRAALEDPHDGPLHHDYRLSRDLPRVDGVR